MWLLMASAAELISKFHSNRDKNLRSRFNERFMIYTVSNLSPLWYYKMWKCSIGGGVYLCKALFCDVAAHIHTH